MLAFDLTRRDAFRRVADQAFRPESLIVDSDRDPLDVILRRALALLADLRGMLQCRSSCCRRLPVRRSLGRRDRRREGRDRGEALFDKACHIRRRIALANPLLDFRDILFVKRQRSCFNHMCDLCSYDPVQVPARSGRPGGTRRPGHGLSRQARPPQSGPQRLLRALPGGQPRQQGADHTATRRSAACIRSALARRPLTRRWCPTRPIAWQPTGRWRPPSAWPTSTGATGRGRRGRRSPHCGFMRSSRNRSPPTPRPTAECPSPIRPRRTSPAVLGTVPVEQDGTQAFTVPVCCELYFQALDQEAWRSRRWALWHPLSAR